ncbi:antitoxin [Gordonia sp. DT219]|uniref:antitoxin n=1 Tax=Gordonia sp. DT219 TaxID=3416658 RepID=UPI003CF3BE4A
MDLKGLVDKAKAALQKNPSLIDKGGDDIDKATHGKYAAQVDKAQDAARKATGGGDAQNQPHDQSFQDQPPHDIQPPQNQPPQPPQNP